MSGRAAIAESLASRLEESERRFRLLDEKIRVLERERQKLSAVVHHADAGFVTFDPALRVVWTNVGFLSRLWAGPAGRTPQGSTCQRVLCMRPEGCEDCPVAGAFRSARVAHGEIRLDRAGRARHIYVTAIPIRSPAGDIDEAIVMLQDVSDLDVLRQSEARKGAVLDAALDAVLSIDHRGTITEFNRSAEVIFGYSRAEVLGREMADLLVPLALRQAHRAGLARHHATGESALVGRRIETTALRKDGTEFPVEISISRIPTPGPPTFTGSIRDLSERMAAERALAESEAELRQAQKMEAVGRLAGGVAHDFNNLLTAITGYGERMLRALDGPEPLRKDLEGILKAAGRAAALTRQLLAFSRRQLLEPRAVDLNAVVSDLLPMLGRLIGEDVELAHVPGPELGTVRADPGRLEQVILNLAANARDAMPRGGALTIRTANVDLDEVYARQHVPLTPGRYVMLTLSDTGVGMDEDTRARIFEPFFTTKEVGRGTGLGLASVYGIVKQSRGYIWVYSEPGRGTTLKIHLPRVDDAVAEPPPPRVAPETSRGSETILVVEDEELVRALTREVLESQGYTVLDAQHGPEALTVLDRHAGAIDLLLTDVVMPHMSGRELARRVVRLRPDIRVLYMSGYTGDAMAQQGVLDEGDSYLDKPFTLDALSRKVREVLDAG